MKLSKSRNDEAIAFLSNSFPGDRLLLRDFFYRVLTLIPHKKFIFYIKEKEIKGFLLLLKRRVWLGGRLFSVCGMSFMAVDKKLKNLSASSYLKKKLFEESKKSDLTIGFARKAIDRYWYPYGFIGVSSFSRFSIDIECIQTLQGDDVFFSDSINNNDIEDLSKIYKITYKNIYGSFFRDKEAWSYLLFSGVKNFNLIKILIKGKIFGYFFYKNNEITEIGIKNKKYEEILNAIYLFFHSKKIEHLIFNLSFNHEISKYLSIYSQERYQKFVSAGGHLIRINNIKSFIMKFKPLLEKQYRDFNLMPFEKKINGITFMYKKSGLKINFDKSFVDDVSTKLRITAFIFMLPGENRLNDFLFNPLSINFSELDQF